MIGVANLHGRRRSSPCYLLMDARSLPPRPQKRSRNERGGRRQSAEAIWHDLQPKGLNAMDPRLSRMVQKRKSLSSIPTFHLPRPSAFENKLSDGLVSSDFHTFQSSESDSGSPRKEKPIEHGPSPEDPDGSRTDVSLTISAGSDSAGDLRGASATRSGSASVRANSRRSLSTTLAFTPPLIDSSMDEVWVPRRSSTEGSVRTERRLTSRGKRHKGFLHKISSLGTPFGRHSSSSIHALNKEQGRQMSLPTGPQPNSHPELATRSVYRHSIAGCSSDDKSWDTGVQPTRRGNSSTHSKKKSPTSPGRMLSSLAQMIIRRQSHDVSTTASTRRLHDSAPNVPPLDGSKSLSTDRVQRDLTEDLEDCIGVQQSSSLEELPNVLRRFEAPRQPTMNTVSEESLEAENESGSNVSQRRRAKYQFPPRPPPSPVLDIGSGEIVDLRSTNALSSEESILSSRAVTDTMLPSQTPLSPMPEERRNWRRSATEVIDDIASPLERTLSPEPWKRTFESRTAIADSECSSDGIPALQWRQQRSVEMVPPQGSTPPSTPTGGTDTLSSTNKSGDLQISLTRIRSQSLTRPEEDGIPSPSGFGTALRNTYGPQPIVSPPPSPASPKEFSGLSLLAELEAGQPATPSVLISRPSLTSSEKKSSAIPSQDVSRARTRRSSQLFNVFANSIKNLLGGETHHSDHPSSRPMSKTSFQRRRHSLAATPQSQSGAVAQLAEFLETRRRMIDLSNKLARADDSDDAKVESDPPLTPQPLFVPKPEVHPLGPRRASCALLRPSYMPSNDVLPVCRSVQQWPSPLPAEVWRRKDLSPPAYPQRCTSPSGPHSSRERRLPHAFASTRVDPPPRLPPRSTSQFMAVSPPLPPLERATTLDRACASPPARTTGADLRSAAQLPTPFYAEVTSFGPVQPSATCVPMMSDACVGTLRSYMEEDTQTDEVLLTDACCQTEDCRLLKLHKGTQTDTDLYSQAEVGAETMTRTPPLVLLSTRQAGSGDTECESATDVFVPQASRRMGAALKVIPPAFGYINRAASAPRSFSSFSVNEHQRGAKIRESATLLVPPR